MDYKIKMLRAILGVNQEQFANLIGVFPLSVWNWENGTNPSRSSMKRVADFLGEDDLDRFMSCVDDPEFQEMAYRMQCKVQNKQIH
ncbi:helix-turn-helix transcriptional regulator [Bacillus sp. TH44]|uniref:helix-turn-helix transcriptional regulator n=1 Tax=unclassified Bacillus (in: firmicutes) TaxID=185979 RepID=UPI0019113102|nr:MULTISPECIES: helix-turn-helix transcriptional regulator [unclassified Bacillus (in: firmicutes)]MBK5349132.1 helix-turn-helix transcriptional regulator [Bacillus sp. TH45]MBK5357832.1 helix-turn-helix transcriptional regulator [Bacillus sp. TH44]MBK5363965.1 helix-turn-helix transcriptional regulator [Bacillus sp. TH50]